MRPLFFLFILCCLAQEKAAAQQSQIFDPQVHTLQVTVDDDPLLPPVVRLNGRQSLTIGFDVLSHEYHRYIYKVEHCNADWTPSTEIFESDYLEGFNDLPIEDYEKSFNTSVLYTHYRIQLPNEDMRLKLSGNYRLTVYGDEESDDKENPVLTACFALTEPGMNVTAQVSSNTDIDFNKTHQQVSFRVNYGPVSVTDPHRELRTVVMQNRRTDNQVVNPKPNMQTNSMIAFEHNHDLIFLAGNEYHKFEILDLHTANLNVDRLDYFEPYHHATLFPDRRAKNYVFDKDQNGAYVIRNGKNSRNDVQSEYVFVHFTLQSPFIPGGNIYLSGEWTYGSRAPEYRMTYNEKLGAYEGTALLKQGYYNYAYLFVPLGETRGQSGPTDGDFYQTENEYSIFVYHRPQGGRYDKLIGYNRFHFIAAP